MTKLKLYRMELDYINAKVTTCCFAYSFEGAEKVFCFKNGDKNPAVKIEEIEIKSGPFLSLTHSIRNWESVKGARYKGVF